MENEKAIELELKNKLKVILSEIPAIKFRECVKRERSAVDLECDVKINGARSRFVVEIKSTGEPRYIRMAIQQLKEYIIKSKRGKIYGLVGVPYLSNESMQICKQNDVGCFDSSGNCLINYQNLYIEKKAYPNKKAEERPIRSIFKAKATRILRVMLSKTKKEWQLQELAKESGVSIGEAFKVKKRLLGFEFIAINNSKIILTAPEKLLNKWAENYSYTQNTLYECYGFGEVKEIEKKISDYCIKNNIPYAFSLFSGADLIASYTRYSKGAVYIKGKISELLKTLGLKQVDSGPNFTILEPYDDGVFYNEQEIRGQKVVGNIQLYLDLKSNKGRGEEAAKFLFEQKIKTQW